MLKGNLASRPFYNERAVNVLLLVVAIIGLALAVFNVTKYLQYSNERTTRFAAQRAAEAKTAELKAQADKERKSVDSNTLRFLGVETAEANALIDQRLFSWTVFWGLVEKTLPQDIRVLSVAPRVEKGDLKIEMGVNAKRRDDIATFLDALQSTGSFYDMNAADMQHNDDGTYTATVLGGYVAPPTQPAKSSAAVGGARRP